MVSKSINTTNFVINKSWTNGKYSTFFDKNVEMRYSGGCLRTDAEMCF